MVSKDSIREFLSQLNIWKSMGADRMHLKQPASWTDQVQQWVTKMVRRSKCMMYEKIPRELCLLRSRKKKLRKDLITAYKCLMGAEREDRAGLFLKVHGNKSQYTQAGTQEILVRQMEAIFMLGGKTLLQCSKRLWNLHPLRYSELNCAHLRATPSNWTFFEQKTRRLPEISLNLHDFLVLWISCYHLTSFYEKDP